MDKALELIRTLIDGANEYEKKTGNTNPTVYLSKNSLLIIEKALERLESIDNANPSEALECLEALEQDIKDRVILAEDRQLKLCVVIKQALIKAEKSLKALEIIKEKRIDIESFYTSFIEGEYDYDFYEIRYGTYGKYCLTEEEFNLLKEILGC